MRSKQTRKSTCKYFLQTIDITKDNQNCNIDYTNPRIETRVQDNTRRQSVALSIAKKAASC